MTRRHVALSLALAGLLLAVTLPASAQSAREETSLADLVRLLQSQDATEEELSAALSAAESLLGDPPACDPDNPMFDDVPADNIFCPFIEELARRGITGGCGGGNFCPNASVTRAQMATFIVKTLGEAAWHEIGAPGEPEFGAPGGGECEWGNFNVNFSSAGFTLDAAGFLHLKGVVQVDDTPSGDCQVIIDDNLDIAARTVFVIPPGFCPGGNRRYVFPVLTNGQLGRITISATDVDPPCGVVVEAPTTFENADLWLSLDGISVRGGD